jgi:hypothetical protein
MGLFAKELAVCAPANEFFGVCQSSWPVETRSKSLADFVNLLEYFSTFLHTDTLHEYA